MISPSMAIPSSARLPSASPPLRFLPHQQSVGNLRFLGGLKVQDAQAERRLIRNADVPIKRDSYPVVQLCVKLVKDFTHNRTKPRTFFCWK